MLLGVIVNIKGAITFIIRNCAFQGYADLELNFTLDYGSNFSF
jgi:hypothetical protein